MRQHSSHSWLVRAVAWTLVPAQVLLAVPVHASNRAQSQDEKSRSTPPPKVKVNRTVPKVTPPPAVPLFSPQPTEGELFRARVFEEPLLPVGGSTTAAENRDLAAALSSYLQAGSSENLTAVEAFLESHPSSAWRASLLTNLGIAYRHTGYFSRALRAWERAWDLAKGETDPRAMALADRALGELAELNGRLGRYEELQALFAETEGRDVRGSATEKLSGARHGLWLMLHQPEDAFRCGPMALDRILAFANPAYQRSPKITGSRSSLLGMSLVQLQALAGELGMGMRMARRVGDAEFLVPAVVHWKAGHFAALVKAENGRYLVQDPTFGEELWVTRAALNDEASGYFLVPGGSLPAGWEAVGEEQGGAIWGKGNTSGGNPQNQKPCDPKSGGSQGSCCNQACCPPPPMATYAVHTMLVNLNITDVPVLYSPPKGPPIRFQVVYNQRDAFQPQIFSYSNLGPKWTFHWLSYFQDDPTNPSQPANLYVPGGGQETYTGYDGSTQSYAPHLESRAVVVRTSTSPIRYERRLPDGWVEVFAQPDGAVAFPRKVFMTQWIDPQGNGVTLTYDESLRIVAATDAIGQVTTLSYELGSDPLKITRVTDPFGRFATFEYNSNGRLSQITDVIGITSQFTYGLSDYISALTTPYGTTSFVLGEAGTDRWIEATDPLGGRERVEYRNLTAIPQSEPTAQVPTGFANGNQYLAYRNTFFWDKRTIALYPGDYTKARIYHWLHTADLNSTAGTLESEKAPLENRVWYRYPGQPTPWVVGTGTQPLKVGRVLDDGTSQVYQYEYNSLGKVTRETDPVGRETVYEYDTNGIDLLRVKQKNGANYELLRSSSYNGQHQPLTATDAAGQTTTYSYLPDGRLQTVVRPPRAGLTLAERTTTYSYYADNAPTGAGRLHTVTGPSTPQGSPITTYTYDGYGRVRTVTGPDAYALTYDYDALDRVTRVTYPDGTYEETVYNRLDAERQRDRLGRWSHTFHDALRRVVATRDPLGRTTTQQWCTCGSLEKIIDAKGNATSWERDLQGRVTREIRPDGAAWEYTYENTTGRLKQRKDPKNQITAYEYFLDNNLKQVTYTGAQVATPNVSFTYDPLYDRLSTMTDGTGTTTYSYTPIAAPPALGAGQLASVDGPLSNDTVSYTYDEWGQTASRGLPGFVSTLTYDGLGRLTTQGGPLGNFSYTFDGTTARPLMLTYPNGQVTQYAFFPNSGDHRLQQIKHLAPGGAPTISQYDYTYDTVGNIATWSQQVGANPAKLYTLGYDAADQLATAKVTGPTPLPVPSRFAYAYDLAGNRTAEQLDDGVLGASYNTRNQLTSRQPGGALLFRGTVNEAATVTVQGKPAPVAADNSFVGPAQVPSGASNVVIAATDPSGNTRTNTYQVTESGSTTSYSYDLNGNLIGDGTRTFEWDAENRLSAVKQGVTTLASFGYDGEARRVQKVAGGVTTTYVYDGNGVIEGRLSTGGTLRYVRGPGIDQHWAMQDGTGTVTYFLSDHLGSIVQTTSATGAVTLSRDYDPYGNLLSGASQSGYAFTGREWDAETGLYYYRQRYYDPRQGRFISADPAGLFGGLNRYTYVDSQPTRRVDPFGLVAEDPNALCSDQLQGCLASAFGWWFVAVVGCAIVCEFIPPQPLCIIVCVGGFTVVLFKRIDFCFDQYEDCQRKRGVVPPPPSPPPSPTPSPTRC